MLLMLCGCQQPQDPYVQLGLSSYALFPNQEYTRLIATQRPNTLGLLELSDDSGDLKIEAVEYILRKNNLFKTGGWQQVTYRIPKLIAKESDLLLLDVRSKNVTLEGSELLLHLDREEMNPYHAYIWYLDKSEIHCIIDAEHLVWSIDAMDEEPVTRNVNVQGVLNGYYEGSAFMVSVSSDKVSFVAEVDLDNSLIDTDWTAIAKTFDEYSKASSRLVIGALTDSFAVIDGDDSISIIVNEGLSRVIEKQQFDKFTPSGRLRSEKERDYLAKTQNRNQSRGERLSHDYFTHSLSIYPVNEKSIAIADKTLQRIVVLQEER